MVAHYHMVKLSQKDHMGEYKFHSLQEDIVKSLLSHGPQTIKSIARDLGKDYKSTYTSVQSLIDKKFIARNSRTEIKGVDYDQYWLSDDGCFVAIANGQSAKSVIDGAMSYLQTANVNLLVFGNWAEEHGAKDLLSFLPFFISDTGKKFSEIMSHALLLQMTLSLENKEEEEIESEFVDRFFKGDKKKMEKYREKILVRMIAGIFEGFG
jgi:hypothetical protein